MVIRLFVPRPSLGEVAFFPSPDIGAEVSIIPLNRYLCSMMSTKLLGILLGVALLIWIIFRWGRRHGAMDEHKKDIAKGLDSWGQSGEKCSVCTCGEGTCSKEKAAPKIDYYDDEELDRFASRSHSDYTPEEVEEFRSVLVTLLPEDVAGWMQSLSRRSIALPQSLMGEAEERLRAASEKKEATSQPPIR